MRLNKMKKICFKDFEFLNLFLEYFFFKCYFFFIGMNKFFLLECIKFLV